MDIDIESIPLPPSVLNRRTPAFPYPCNGMMPPLPPPPAQPRLISSSKLHGNCCKLVDALNNKKNKIASIDLHQNPTLSNLNATFRKICRSSTTPSPLHCVKERTFDRRKLPPFESFAIDADTYHDYVANNQPLPMNVNRLQHNGMQSSMFGSRNHTSSTLADIQSVHASTCNLVTALRQSNPSINGIGGCMANGHFGTHCNSTSTMNLRYGSLRSQKRSRKRSNSEQLHSSYYHFQNIDGDMDNNSTEFDSALLPVHGNGSSHNLSWKRRECQSPSSSSSNSSSLTSTGFCIEIHFFE